MPIKISGRGVLIKDPGGAGAGISLNSRESLVGV